MSSVKAEKTHPNQHLSTVEAIKTHKTQQSQWRSHDRSRERGVSTPCDNERFDKRRNLFQCDVNQTNFRTFANQTNKTTIYRIKQFSK